MIQCSNITTLVTAEDFECVGQIAKHCNWNQLCIYIQEQTNLFLIPKVGYCLIHAILNNQNNETIQKLWCGCEYECNGEKKIHFGLKRVLLHAVYGVYVYRHSYIDTPVGVVQKLNNDSVVPPIKELKDIMNENYKNAEIYLEQVKEYLCTIKDNEIIKECIDIPCGECKCGSKENTTIEQIQTRNNYSQNITKW